MTDPRSTNRGTFYQITVRGQLDPSWSEWFNGLAVATRPGADGSTETDLTGHVPDQAALHGLLMRIRDLGLVLLEVKCVAGRKGAGKGVPRYNKTSVSS